MDVAVGAWHVTHNLTEHGTLGFAAIIYRTVLASTLLVLPENTNAEAALKTREVLDFGMGASGGQDPKATKWATFICFSD